MSPAGRARPAARERIAQAFTQVEDVLYVGIAVLLAAGAVGLLLNAAVTFARGIGAGTIGGSIVGMLDQLLLILMMIEILYTVQVSFREHVLVPEPFVLVAMIAAVRRILVLTAEFGKLMEQGLEIIKRLWTEDKVDGSYPPYNLRGAVMQPKPVQKPHPPILIGGYVDAVLKRVATKGDGWLTYYYTVDSFKKSWAKIRAFAEEAGRDPDTLISTNQLPICVGPRAKIEAPMKHWLQTEWDYASWSESTMDSAIMGTPEECIEQLQPHIEAGIDRIIFVPYKYEKEQVEAVAQQVIPRLKKGAK